MGKTRNEAVSSTEPHKRSNAKLVVFIVILLEELRMKTVAESSIVGSIIPCDGDELWRDV